MARGDDRSTHIYRAVHEAVMQVRIRWAMAMRETPPAAWDWDAELSRLQYRAASEAARAFAEPLRKKRR